MPHTTSPEFFRTVSEESSGPPSYTSAMTTSELCTGSSSISSDTRSRTSSDSSSLRSSYMSEAQQSQPRCSSFSTPSKVSRV